MGGPSCQRRRNQVGRRQEQAGTEEPQVHETQRPLLFLPLRHQGPPRRWRCYCDPRMVFGGRRRQRCCGGCEGGWGDEEASGLEGDERGWRAQRVCAV